MLSDEQRDKPAWMPHGSFALFTNQNIYNFEHTISILNYEAESLTYF